MPPTDSTARCTRPTIGPSSAASTGGSSATDSVCTRGSRITTPRNGLGV